MMDGCVTVLSLLLIPSCETFVSVIESPTGPKWNIVLFFVVFNLIFPILLNIALILCEHKSTKDKYKDGWYKWFETADVSQKIIYAIIATYNYPWACAGLQIAWMIAYCIFLPCSSVSDNVLNIGESLVLIIVNILIAVNSESKKLFPFGLCIGLMVVACLPVIIASYCFFIFDFSFGESNKEVDSGLNFKAMRIYYIFCLFGIPIACLLYGMNVPMIYDL